jgi:hypothetical protein
LKNATGGSDVSHVIEGDHATAAAAYLVAKGYADKWQVVLPEEKMLMLDYDEKKFDGYLPDQFYRTLVILEQALESYGLYFTCTESKGGNTHCLVHLPSTMPTVERIAWQAAFGSDPKREALHLLSLVRGELNPILLFMRKVEPTQALLTAKPEQKLLTEGDGNAD